MDDETFLAPMSSMTAVWGINRDRLLRAIAARRIRGELRFGRWLVDTRDGDAARALRAERPARTAGPTFEREIVSV